ncbi:MAG: hypothetical protein M1839_009058 [Geoglossum umbratile]|nr:MAG: hypothetical protein M1839_009058 [Geoglossum umbratile]
MEQSPLTQQARPESFQPKIVGLYEALFKDDEDADKSEGFWREFFLLRPDPASLRQALADLSADDLLNLQVPYRNRKTPSSFMLSRLQAQTHQLFSNAVSFIKAGVAPSDEIALDVSLSGVLDKKYTNTSSDVIAVLAGLDQVDVIFTEFVNALDNIIRNGRHLDIRQKAIEVALSVTSGAYQTGLLSYFTHRDLFPSLMKYIQELDTVARVLQPFSLLGLLVNYNKFEFQNPYRLRLDDFVNETIIRKIIKSIGQTSSSSRDRYVAVQDDLPEGWNLNSTLTFFGLGGLAQGAKAPAPAPNPDAAKALFAALPGPEAAVLLATYDFANANKIFCFNLVSSPAESKREESPFGAYLSLTSYVLSHAHRSARSTLYAHLNLLVLRIIAEDSVLLKRICSDESKTIVRLCRHKQPHLPLVRGERVLATAMLDTMIDGINHNLRRRLDVGLYMLSLYWRSVTDDILSQQESLYHWAELWRSILSLVRFLSSYASDLKSLPNIGTLLDNVVNLVALSLSTGDAFLPGPAEYDDLFYKLVETGDILVKFRDLYELDKRPSNSIATLISVSEHYYQLLTSDQSKTRTKFLSPQQVSNVIKSGYETLSITAKDGLDSWDRYREADERVALKKVARAVVADVRTLLRRGE